MLIASEKAKKGIDRLPKLRNLNDALANDFTEEELQMMFDDLRYFFPDEKIYKRLALFHELDIFEGEHFRIKEAYQKRQLLKQSHQKKKRMSVYAAHMAKQ